MKLKVITQIAGAAALLALAACAPISPDFAGSGTVRAGSTVPAVTPAAGTVPALGGTVPAVGGTIPVAAATPTGLAVATVTTPSLRVRALPSATGTLLGALASGETYGVLSRSSDGAWLELAIPQLAQGSGWVSAGLVSVNGDITDTPISVVPDATATTAPTATPTESPTATATLEPTATPTEEPTATATEPPTATPTLEPTATPTQPPTATPTATPTSEPTATLPPTATPTRQPTATATALPTEEPTEEPTALPIEEPAEEPTATAAAIVLPTSTPRPQVQPVATATPIEEAPTAEPVIYAAPAAGFALVTAEPRLRVRSAPSTDGEIIGYAYPGEVFPVLGTNEDGTWTQIGGSAESAENPNGGWVASQFLLLGQ